MTSAIACIALGLQMAEVFVLFGFFMVYFMEEMTHSLIHKYMAPPNKQVVPTSPAWCQEESQPVLTNGGHSHCHEDVTIEFIDSNASTFEATLRGFLIILALR